MSDNSTPKKRQILVDLDLWREISHMAIDLDIPLGDVVREGMNALKERLSNGGASQPVA